MEPANNQLAPNDPQPAAPVKTPPNSNDKFLVIAIVVTVIVLVIFIVSLVTHHKHKSVVATVTTSTSQALPAAQVSIAATGFSPATIKVKPGQTVTWTNKDSKSHEPASDPYPSDNGLAGFDDSTPLTTGESYGFTFNTAGTYTYHDNLNPLQKGTVIVK